MSIEKYNIGGVVKETEAFEAFADIPQNRVLLAEKLSNHPPVKPEIVEGLGTIEQVFEHFKPTVNVQFETEQGTINKEALCFQGLSDFGIKGITSQSKFLGDLAAKKQQYLKIAKQIRTNKLLRQALTQKDSKAAIIGSINALILELEQLKGE